jgi:fatty acid synthase
VIKMNISSEKCRDEDDVVVTGIAGRFPKSRNVRELASNLFNKVNMTDDSDDRWNSAAEKIPARFGKIADIDKFDAKFFSFLSKSAMYTDPQMRMLLEHAYEAIIDAGVSPQTLIKSNTSVFAASYTSDSKENYIQDVEKLPTGLLLTG